MILELQRLRNNGDTTIGKLTSGIFISHTLEDEPREIKIKGETRIPAGKYEIKERKVLSPLTQKYRKNLKWFRWHLELQDVPGFQYVYIHIGNDDDDTEACILVGYQQADWRIWKSAMAFRDLYFYIVGALQNGKVFIEIRDE